MAAESDTQVDANEQLVLRAPIEIRRAQIDDVNFSERIITVIAAPYEQETEVIYRGEPWTEVFTRGAFDSVIDRPNRVRVNRDHDSTRTVGKVVQFLRDRNEGLIAEMRIAKTALGDETLALADEDCLSASVGASALPRDINFNRSNKMRRVNKAYLKHIALLENPAYDGAKVLSVRNGNTNFVDSATLPKLVTPNLDQMVDEMRDILQWSSDRRNKQ
jgi:HK97 family phage prohead protease